MFKILKHQQIVLLHLVQKDLGFKKTAKKNHT